MFKAWRCEGLGETFDWKWKQTWDGVHGGPNSSTQLRRSVAIASIVHFPGYVRLLMPVDVWGGLGRGGSCETSLEQLLYKYICMNRTLGVTSAYNSRYFLDCSVN